MPSWPSPASRKPTADRLVELDVNPLLSSFLRRGRGRRRCTDRDGGRLTAYPARPETAYNGAIEAPPAVGRSLAMNREELRAALSLLVDEMDGEIEDSHEVYLRLTMLLNQMRALNMPVPEDLAQMEADMSKEFAAEAADADDTPKPDA